MQLIATPAPASLMQPPSFGARTDAKLQQARDALAALKAAKTSTSASESRRAAAQDKLGRLKQRLKTLMMMGGDPKVVARQVAKIAKDIAQAAKDYAAAGGKDPAMMTPAASPAPADTAEPPAPDGEPQAAAAPATDAAKPSPAAFSLGAEDPFMTEAKDMVKTARAILERELRKARQKDRHDPTLDKLQADGDEAAREVDKAARDLKFADEMGASYAPGAAGVVNIAAPSTPAVMVTA